jgi:hypothetical protein
MKSQTLGFCAPSRRLPTGNKRSRRRVVFQEIEETLSDLEPAPSPPPRQDAPADQQSDASERRDGPEPLRARDTKQIERAGENQNSRSQKRRGQLDGVSAAPSQKKNQRRVDEVIQDGCFVGGDAVGLFEQIAETMRAKGSQRDAQKS